MNVVVLSDTHLPGRARRLPGALTDELARADLIVHAGDFATVDAFDMLRGFAPVRAATISPAPIGASSNSTAAARTVGR